MPASRSRKLNIGKEWARRMVDKFGTTDNIKRTAFVLPDGRWVAYLGTGKATHSDMVAETTPSAFLDRIPDFLQHTGAIRLHRWAGVGRGSDAGNWLSVETHLHRITPGQARALQRFFASGGRRYSWGIDVTCPKGKSDYCAGDKRASLEDVTRCMRKAIKTCKGSGST